MYVTLDQARAFDALASQKTLTAAAKYLGKAHTAILYAVAQLESQLDLKLLDRSQYRLQLTDEGLEVLEKCRALLLAETRLLESAKELRSGWEPSIKIVMDSIVETAPVMQAVASLLAEGANTQVHLLSSSLEGVETKFKDERAHLMVSLLPVAGTGLGRVVLRPLPALLVIKKGHPLTKLKTISRQHLAEYPLITVGGSDPRLQLPTAHLESQSQIQVPDFYMKRTAILAGLGFGWLPDWLVGEDLRQRKLVAIGVSGVRGHQFKPELHYRRSLGPFGRRLVAMMKESQL